MIARFFGASGRAVCVVLLVAAPGFLIPGVPEESTQFAFLIALFAGVLTLVEYASPTPVMVEFRDAPPYNKIRFLMLAVLLASVTFVAIGATSYAAGPSQALSFGQQLAHFLDVNYSPVRLMVRMLPDNLDQDAISLMQAVTSVALLVSCILMLGTVVYFKGLGWPNRRDAFNVHTNLPMFDPTSGGDVVIRLRRGARINLLVGITVPFIIPACLQIFGPFVQATQFTNLQTLVWLVALWAFLPLNLCLRGMVMGMLVELIEAKRRQRYLEIQEDGLLA